MWPETESTEDLEKLLAIYKLQMDELRTALKNGEENIDAVEAELERREIEALPLKIGDKLLVTPDLFPKYAPYMQAEAGAFVATIDAFAGQGGVLQAWCGNGGVPIEEAIRMNAAYLATHENEVSE